ncbi:MAG TPA: TlpA disulfide reductase family protein [Candidatus Polarisedimenticolaceae bacterium]|nr:TlpA disulfide reductase family protein [Candidatus Polarisedimenticolaceae bacterium]
MKNPLAPALVLAAVALASAAPLPTTDPGIAVHRPGPIDRGDDAEASRLIGIQAPALPELSWLDGQKRTLASLAGKVVVIRNFTNECPFCASTMPALENLAQRYRDRGVVVLGVYHPKPPAPIQAADVATFVKSLGVTFPVAVDDDWTLERGWWEAYGGGDWTSITWVLDRKGTIRAVHPGGEYHEGGGEAHARCRSDYAQLTRTIDTLLAER